MIFRVMSVLSVALLLPSQEVAAQQLPPQSSVSSASQTVQSVRRPNQKYDFITLGHTGAKTAPAEWDVSHGQPADPKSWPATLISQPSGCTATFVGRRAMLTAAHCVENKQVVMAYIAGRTRNLTCYRHTDYSADYDVVQSADNWNKTSADYALCLLADKDAVTGITFEVLWKGPNQAKKEGQILLLGFGCNGDTPASDGYGFLRSAPATVSATPDTTPSNNYFITYWGDGGFKFAKGGALCPGDSGGAAYWPIGPGAQRRIPTQFRRWVLADGKTWPGLVTRREGEIALFFDNQVIPKGGPTPVLPPIDIRRGESDMH